MYLYVFCLYFSFIKMSHKAFFCNKNLFLKQNVLEKKIKKPTTRLHQFDMWANVLFRSNIFILVFLAWHFVWCLFFLKHRRYEQKTRVCLIFPQGVKYFFLFTNTLFNMHFFFVRIFNAVKCIIFGLICINP